jgi:hypothetical protein
MLLVVQDETALKKPFKNGGDFQGPRLPASFLAVFVDWRLE